MPWFKIYAGLGGSFGGASYQGTYEYADINEAIEDAYRMAEEEYQSYEGCHGVMNWQECYEDLRDSFAAEPEEEDVNLRYREEIESWISYEVKPAIGPEDGEEE